jgi:hypothetical protein
MNNESNIKALMQLVKESVENKSLSKDYGSLLDICRKSNISSYTLNVLIEGAVSSVNSDKHVQSLPCFGWSPAVIQQSETSEKIIHEGVKIKVFRWGWKTWMLFVALLVITILEFCILITDPFIKFKLDRIF